MKKIDESWAIQATGPDGRQRHLIGYPSRAMAEDAIKRGFVVIPEGWSWTIGYNTFVTDVEPMKRSVEAWAEIVNVRDGIWVIGDQLGLAMVRANRTDQCNTKVRITVEEIYDDKY